jgi:hypothetical protein
MNATEKIAICFNVSVKDFMRLVVWNAGFGRLAKKFPSLLRQVTRLPHCQKKLVRRARFFHLPIPLVLS